MHTMPMLCRCSDLSSRPRHIEMCKIAFQPVRSIPNRKCHMRWEKDAFHAFSILFLFPVRSVLLFATAPTQQQKIIIGTSGTGGMNQKTMKSAHQSTGIPFNEKKNACFGAQTRAPTDGERAKTENDWKTRIADGMQSTTADKETVVVNIHSFIKSISMFTISPYATNEWYFFAMSKRNASGKHCLLVHCSVCITERTHQSVDQVFFSQYRHRRFFPFVDRTEKSVLINQQIPSDKKLSF